MSSLDAKTVRPAPDDEGVGLLDTIRHGLGLAAPSAAAVASPWIDRPTHLDPVVMRDIFGADLRIPRAITREEAVRVPALARARGLIVTTIARLPLVAVDDDGENMPDATPDFITDTRGPVTPFHRMLWTADDLFFYGWSLWAVARDGAGHVIAAERVARERWAMTSDGAVEVDGRPAADRDVVLIPGVTEGILTHGAATLDQALRIAAAVTRASENPVPQVELHQLNDAPMTTADIEELKLDWMRAGRGENGGVAFTNGAVEARPHGTDAGQHLLIDGRNAVAVDIARHAGIPAPMIDATLAGSSLSYENTASRMSELVTFGLAPIMAAIAARLSQDDVTPPHVKLSFDTTETIQQLASVYTDKHGNDQQIENPFDERKSNDG